MVNRLYAPDRTLSHSFTLWNQIFNMPCASTRVNLQNQRLFNKLAHQYFSWTSFAGQPPPPPPVNMSLCGVKTGTSGRLLSEEIPSLHPLNFQGLDSSLFANFVRSNRSMTASGHSSFDPLGFSVDRNNLDYLDSSKEVTRSLASGSRKSDCHSLIPAAHSTSLQRHRLAQSVDNSDSSVQLDFAGHPRTTTEGQKDVQSNDPTHKWSGFESIAFATIPIVYNGGQVVTYTMNV